MRSAKYLFTTACILFFSLGSNAQGPQLINYQAIARDASGSIIVSHPVGVQLTITDGSPTGATQYQETQTVTTNAFGLLNLQVGGGTVISGTMSAITWSSGTKYLLVGIDPAGGISYTPMGSQQLVSVPYALYTDNAANAVNLTGTITMGGDVTGTNSAATVVKIQGHPVSATAPTSGQVLEWTTGGTWAPVTEALTGWSLTGNAGTTPATNFVGTTDNNALRFRVNSVWAGELNPSTFNASYGLNAGKSVTSGSNNAATGANALYSNLTGNSNVAIGTQALYTSATNSNQVAIGDSALYTNNGSLGQNVAIGSKALFAAITGYENTATGFQSLYTNTSGYENTAYGYQSLYGNTSGYGNTGVGWAAYPSLATLFNWTAIGYNAGGSYSTSNSVELGNTSVTVIRAQVTGITAISDGRIKDNVKANVPGLEFINRLRPVTYNLNIHRQNAIIYKDKKGADKDWDGKYDVEKKTMSGFIAQEVDQAAKAARYDFCGVEQPATPDGLYGIRYTDFIMPLVKSVQELSAEKEAQEKTIEGQAQTISGLQSQMAELLKRVQDLENKK